LWSASGRPGTIIIFSLKPIAIENGTDFITEVRISPPTSVLQALIQSEARNHFEEGLHLIRAKMGSLTQRLSNRAQVHNRRIAATTT
jgi:hypothetical protein